MRFCRWPRRGRVDGRGQRSDGYRDLREAPVHPQPNDRTALAPRETILENINRYYGQIEGESADSMLQEFTDTAIDFTETEQDDRKGGHEGVDENSAPIVRLVHLMISEAVQLRASDIHIEPFEDRIRIRYRIDGVLMSGIAPPPIAGGHHLPHQDSGEDGHCRATSPPGRADQGDGGGQGYSICG
jgi:type II secretory ATPase GspE/PulE/Tfp pilus assembly ATPase PilB-like protein